MPQYFIEKIRRLDFVLPPFRRVAWTTNEARTVWEPRLRAINAARPLIFLHAIKANIYPCVSLRLTDDEIATLKTALQSESNLNLTYLDEREARNKDRYRFVMIGTSRLIEDCKKASENLLDELQKAPVCCRAFRSRIRNEWKLFDPVLAQAINTADAIVESHIIQLKPEPLLNTLPIPLGVFTLGHTPCSMGCQASLNLAEALVTTARANGFDEEMTHMEELLSWPMEWSALHGIAEVKLPILKFITNTDATAETYRVRVISDNYPAESVNGISFPYRQPTLAKITDSKAFKEGLANPIRLQSFSPNESLQKSVVTASGPVEVLDNAGVKLKTRDSIILDETIARLRLRTSIDALEIEAFFLSNYFNVVRLSDGSTGACMNYYRFKSAEAAERTREQFLKRVKTDPLLLDYLSEGAEPDLLQLSLKTCLVSALSQKIFHSPDTFRLTNRFDPNLFPAVESAVVIGFGGYMDYLIHLTDIKRIHVSDFWYHLRAKSIKRRLALYKEKFPQKDITFSDGTDNRERIIHAELVSITGSALCSGTMDELLTYSVNCKRVIVQGQSGAILPDVLFEKGVSLVSTSIKPANLIELAQSDPQQFKALLEGKLPVIYLEPLNKG